jgi:hypothetical protein
MLFVEERLNNDGGAEVRCIRKRIRMALSLVVNRSFLGAREYEYRCGAAAATTSRR